MSMPMATRNNFLVAKLTESFDGSTNLALEYLDNFFKCLDGKKIGDDFFSYQSLGKGKEHSSEETTLEDSNSNNEEEGGK
jgi:hypothetical protein